MSEAAISAIIMNIVVFLIFGSLFIWGIRTGQFKDIEEPSYRMLELENLKVKRMEGKNDV